MKPLKTLACHQQQPVNNIASPFVERVIFMVIFEKT